MVVVPPAFRHTLPLLRMRWRRRRLMRMMMVRMVMVMVLAALQGKGGRKRQAAARMRMVQEAFEHVALDAHRLVAAVVWRIAFAMPSIRIVVRARASISVGQIAAAAAPIAVSSSPTATEHPAAPHHRTAATDASGAGAGRCTTQAY